MLSKHSDSLFYPTPPLTVYPKLPPKQNPHSQKKRQSPPSPGALQHRNQTQHKNRPETRPKNESTTAQNPNTQPKDRPRNAQNTNDRPPASSPHPLYQAGSHCSLPHPGGRINAPPRKGERSSSRHDLSRGGKAEGDAALLYTERPKEGRGERTTPAATRHKSNSNSSSKNDRHPKTPKKPTAQTPAAKEF